MLIFSVLGFFRNLYSFPYISGFIEHTFEDTQAFNIIDV